MSLGWLGHDHKNPPGERANYSDLHQSKFGTGLMRLMFHENFITIFKLIFMVIEVNKKKLSMVKAKNAHSAYCNQKKRGV